MKKQLITSLLSVSMLVSLCACGGEPSNPTGDTVVDTTSAEPVDTDHDVNGFLLDSLDPSVKFDGKTANILIRADVAKTEFYVEDQTGEIVDDALYKRNQTVEERLGVKLNFIEMPGDWANRETFNGAIRQSVMAADGAYDLCAVLSNQLGTLTLDGLLMNLNSLDYLDFSKPWWAGGLLDELAVDGKLYFASGDASLGLINGMICVFYNKNMAKEFSLPDMYELVNNGEWTIDKAVELTQNVYQDLDSDGAKSDNDRFGFTTGSFNHIYGFLDSFQVQILERDSEGCPSKFVFGSEKNVDIVQKLVSLFKDNAAFATKSTDSSVYMEAFQANRVLFCTGEFKDTGTYRTIADFDYGVIPMPKWDTVQEKYGTTVRATYSSFCIPKTASAPDMSAAVLECFASESYRTVSPTYFETALKVKYSRDDETSQMFDLIKDSVKFSFATSFTTSIGDPQNTFKGKVSSYDANWASYMASWEPSSQTKLDKAIEIIKGLD